MGWMDGVECAVKIAELTTCYSMAGDVSRLRGGLGSGLSVLGHGWDTETALSRG